MLNRRTALIAAALALLGYTLFRITASAVPPIVACRGCNVVLISLDTLRADHLGVYGHDRPTSPFIDALARRSTVFTNAISQSAWTRPAHASMLTGLYPAEHGIIAMDGRRGLTPELLTLPAVLAGHGYETAAFTGGANMSAHFGFGSGFDVYGSPGRRIEDTLDDVRALLERRPERFFLFAHGFDAHRPYKSEPVDRAALGLPPQRARGMLKACQSGGGREALEPFVAEYDAAVHRGDRGVGALLALLDEYDLADRTVVIVTSDHGEEFLEHGRCFHIRALHREVVRVPLVVHVPGVEPAVVSTAVPASVSIAPTVAELVGVVAHGLPGPSLAAAVAGAPQSPGFVVSETSSRLGAERGKGHVISLTGDTEKLVWWIAQDRYEYFDLVKDPGENDPAGDPPRMAALVESIERWRARHPEIAEHGVAPPLPRRLARELRTLGYVE